MRIGSLFSGYGGLDLAAMQLFPGSSVAWHCEWDDAPSKILDFHWPTVPNYRDVTKVNWSTVPPVDVLTGGFPCQPFSAAGRREGQNDERHLWPYVLEVIRALRPKYTLLENVAGLRSIGDHVDEYTFRCVCGWFGGRGGLHYSQDHESEYGDGYSRPDRDGNESQRSSEADAVRVFGHSDHTNASECEAFGCDDMDSDRRGSGCFPESRSSALAFERGAGGTSTEDRRDPNISAADRNSGPSSVVAGSAGSVPADLPADHGTERAWADTSGGDTSGWSGDCPSCGRDLGDGSSGSVFRSGMGTIFRDLASLGLYVQWTSLRASDVGAPHHRERLFILVTDPSSSRPESIDGFTGRGATRSGGYGQPRGSNRGTSPDTDRGQCDRDERTKRRGTLERETSAGNRFGLSADAEGERQAGFERGGGSPAEVTDVDCGVGSLSDTERIGRDGRGIRPGDEEGERSSRKADRRSEGVEWGDYAPAIRRWERITRPAPSPTELNSNNRPRLNAAFGEWMMGLPAGHVTDPAIGISRAHQLKAIGNGVCPPQAVAAYSSMLARLAVAA